MLTILVTVLLVGLALLVLLWIGTLWAQGYFYDSPVDNLSWRAPATAGALAVFYLLWLVVEYRRPNTTDSIFRVSTERSEEHERFISLRRTEEGEQEIPFERRTLAGGRIVYLDEKGTTWARSKSGMMIAIILEEPVDDSGERKMVRRRFNAELSADGKTFAPRVAGGSKQQVRYHEEGGDRVIIEDNPGKVFSYRRGLLYFNLILNLVHFAVWFVLLWLILQFQWPHALLGAAGCWLVVTVALVPFMVDRARVAAVKRPAPRVTALLLDKSFSASPRSLS